MTDFTGSSQLPPGLVTVLHLLSDKRLATRRQIGAFELLIERFNAADKEALAVRKYRVHRVHKMGEHGVIVEIMPIRLIFQPEIEPADDDGFFIRLHFSLHSLCILANA